MNNQNPDRGSGTGHGGFQAFSGTRKFYQPAAPGATLHDLSKIPDELIILPQWVCWKSVPAKPKPRKIPIDPKTGDKAKANDPSTWSTFEQAMSRLEQDRTLAGIGFEFSPDDPYCGVDLDNCYDPESSKITPIKLEIDKNTGEVKRTIDPLKIIKVLSSYTELSPSGTGFHIIAKGKLPPEGRKKQGFEIYDQGRFFTFTGRHWNGTPTIVEDCQGKLDALHRYVFARPKQDPSPHQLANPGNPLPLSDFDLIEKARNAENGRLFDTLWNGDTGLHGGDHSAADLALCSLLAFWADRNPEHMDRLFRLSGLMRRKWDEKHYSDGRTYGQATIQKALESKTVGYTSKTNMETPVTGEAMPDTWPDPAPLPGLLPAVEAFNPQLLPRAFRPWIEDIAERIQCPPDFPAVAAMVGLSAIVGRQIGIRPKRFDNWTVIPNLWGAVIGRPGVMKTPAMDEPLRPLEHLEAQARATYERAKGNWDTDRLIAKEHKKVIADAIRKAIKEGRDPLAIAQATLSAENEAPPPRRRYKTNDPTVEKLGELLNETPRGLLVFRDELIGWLRSLDKEGSESARSFYLEAWNGDKSYTYDRIGRGTIGIEAACVAILGGIQPSRLLDYMQGALTGGADDDGLLQRFQLLVWPDISTDWRDVDRWPNRQARHTAWEVFRRLDHIDLAAIGAQQDDHGQFPYVRFTPEAQMLFSSEWRPALERRIRGGNEHPAFEAHLSKYRSLVPSLALLYHLADTPDTRAVGENALNCALAWAKFLESHARRLYSPVLTPEVPTARELDYHLRRGDLPNPFSVRDVVRKGWRNLDLEGAFRAVKFLTSLNHLIPQTLKPGPEGGRSTVMYHINPKVDQAP